MQYGKCRILVRPTPRSERANWEHVCPSAAERDESDRLRRELAARDATLRDAKVLLDFLGTRNPAFAR